MTAESAAPFIAILDYGIGNLHSAHKAFEKVGADARLVTTAAEAVGAAGVVLPGVGSFGRCIDSLRDGGLDVVALDAIAAATPFLGVCVGMQMLFEGSDESPSKPGLGVFPGMVRLLPDGVKRPQMQWNILQPVVGRPCPLLDGLPDPPWVYFVHSYAPENDTHVVATCDYGGPVTALVQADGGAPLWAAQFHPEKSGETGLAILRRFVDLCR